MTPKATSRDVAHLAGVSQSTVSYVMSGKRPVAPETERRVRAAMEELSYRPHASARALKSDRSAMVAVVVPYHEHTDAPGQYRYIVSLAAACRSHDRELLVISAEEGIEGMERLIGSALCGGILVMDVREDDERVAMARQAGLPCVFVGLSRDTSGVIATDTDFEAIGVGCVEHIVARGHSEMVLINPASTHIAAMGFSRRFTRTVQRQAHEAGLGLRIVAVPRGFAAMHRALSDLLSEHDYDAFTVAPASSADDVINVLQLLGRRIGAHCSVIGASGSGDSPHSPVDYTYFDADLPRVARTAVGLLVAQLDGEISPEDHAPVMVPPVFHDGVSLVPLPAGGS